jgi:L-alanine-DL-glutamate epimerase-like enolase superfamily enzyme
MKITAVHTRTEHLELLRPYTIAYKTTDAVTNLIVAIETDRGITGLGAASPGIHVTGESVETCQQALSEANLQWLIGQDVRTLPALCRRLGEIMADTPAAQAALDIALHDALAQYLELPLVDMLGRVHDRLPTSITIGIKSTEEALIEADEYLGRGFKVLKVKLGQSLEQDLERLHKLRVQVGKAIKIRVDPNQGYSAADVQRFVEQTAGIDIEFLEQPMPADQIDQMRSLPDNIRQKLAADETLLNEKIALELVAPPAACGIFNIKLMKCGGVNPAMRIATIAEIAGIKLMWGCMDESIISITAALHAALASPATRYLDLDGSLDLARDVVSGGFVLQDGFLSTSDAPGLGLNQL